jgi:hypothetical protein
MSPAMARNSLPLPLREGVGGEGFVPRDPLPPTRSLKGRGSLLLHDDPTVSFRAGRLPRPVVNSQSRVA